MYSTAFAALAALGGFALVSAAPNPAAVSIGLPTGEAAATAAPPVPTVGDLTSASDKASARGSATVHNDCGFEVYVYVCGQGHGTSPPSCTKIHDLAAHTGTYSEVYIPYVNDGRSIKISPDNGEGAKPILQFEYTVNKANNRVYFDLSEVNGKPFSSNGFALTDSAGLHKYCAPNANCPWVFTDPTNGNVYNVAIGDSIATTVCGN